MGRIILVVTTTTFLVLGALAINRAIENVSEIRQEAGTIGMAGVLVHAEIN